MNRKLLIVAVVASLLVAPVLPAQRFSEGVQITVIEVPVTVSDRAGNAIRDLTKENFEVYDDGKRVPIEYFEVVDLAKISTQSKKPLPPAAYRNFLLLFDFANSRPGTIQRAQVAAREFVTTQLKDRDLVGVASYTAQSGLKMLTAFTGDRRLVATAIDTLSQTAGFKVADPLMLTGDAKGSDTNLQPSGGNAGAKDEIANALTVEFAEMTKMNVATHDEEMRTRIRTQLSNFGGVARALDRLRGQKQIILLSEGFDARLVSGRQELGFQKTQKENDAVLSGEVWNVNSEERFGSTSGTSEIQQMSELFKRSDVRMHAIDIKGIRTDVDAREGSMKSSNEALYLVTRPTGGSVFKNANDLGTNFEALVKKQEVIYLLGFHARSSGKPGKFHNLKVKSTVKGAELSHRSGYYEPLDKPDLAQTLSMAEVIVTDTPIDDVPLSMFVAPSPAGPNAARVPVVVEIPGTKLLEDVKGNSLSATLYVYAFDDKREVRDSLQQRISLDLTKAGDSLRKSGIRYIGALRLPPGEYAVKALVRVDDTGRMGFLRSDVTVPTFRAKSVIAPIALGDPTQGITLVNPVRGQDAAAVLSIGGQPFVPKSNAIFANATDQRIVLLLYQMPAEDLGVTPAIVGPDGTSKEATLKLVGRTSADPSGVSRLVFDFKPEGLAQGQYTLRFTVTPKGGTPAIASLPFTIQ